MSWFSGLSVGSFFQNVGFYLFLFTVAHINYCLVVAVKDKKRKSAILRNESIMGEGFAGLEEVLEDMSDAVYMVDRDWNFIFVNKAYERLQCRDRAQLLGRNVWELFPYGKEHRYFKEYDYALREQVSVHFEEFNTFNGMWVSASAYPVKCGLAISFRDITKEKLMRKSHSF